MNTRADDKPVFAFWLYLMSDCVLFASLFAAYAVLGGATFGGPGARELAVLQFVFTETILLLTSSLTAGLALLAARRHKRTLALALLGMTFLLGAAFLAMEASEFAHLVAEGHGPQRSAFLSAFFTLVGTHGLHVALGLLWLVVVVVHLARARHGALQKLAAFALFWHFLDLVWVCIFTFVYLFGALSL